MKPKTRGGFGECLPAYCPHIEIAFPSCCLRAVPHKVSGFRHFRSDYPTVHIALILEISVAAKSSPCCPHIWLQDDRGPLPIPRLPASVAHQGTEVVH